MEPPRQSYVVTFVTQNVTASRTARSPIACSPGRAANPSARPSGLAVGTTATPPYRGSCSNGHENHVQLQTTPACPFWCQASSLAARSSYGVEVDGVSL